MNNDYLKDMDEALGITTLVTGTVNGEDFWAYVDVDPSKFEDLQKVIENKEPYTLTDYGSVIKYGLGGHQPPEEVVEEMKEKRGFDPEFEDKLMNDVKRQIKQLGKPGP